MNGSLIPRPFSGDWYNRLIDTWNQPLNIRHQRAMADAGLVSFAVVELDGSESSVLLNFDVNGKIELRTACNQLTPYFCAKRAVWMDFIEGRISAVSAVLCGKIVYRGKAAFALRYGPEFDRVSLISRQILSNYG